jgi:chorismate mutase/prephenate dehydrogenase
VITETTPADHDRAMSVVQVLTHFQTQVLGVTLARLGVPLDETLRFTSPAYLIELYVAARHFAQSPARYGPIEMRNPRRARSPPPSRTRPARWADVLARATGRPSPPSSPRWAASSAVHRRGADPV